jgi:hypothetical protein
MLSNDLPSALSPVYATSKPNESIRLYEGLLKITQERTLEQEDGSKQTKEIIECGNGLVEFIWFPNPRIKFKFKNYNHEHHPTMVLYYPTDDTVVTVLNLCGFNTSVSVSISRFCRDDATNEVEGLLKETIDYGLKDNLAHVLFHVANFHECEGFYPTVVELEEWKLTLDRLETTKENAELLKSQGGFAITHIGKLEQSDGKTFSGIEAIEFLGIFRHFLSFSRGLRIPVILFVGYDADGKQIWNYWKSSGGDSWRRVESWFPVTESKCLAEIFPGFVSWWRDWGESALLTLYWYIGNYHRTSCPGVGFAIHFWLSRTLHQPINQKSTIRKNRACSLANKMKRTTVSIFKRSALRTGETDPIPTNAEEQRRKYNLPADS